MKKNLAALAFCSVVLSAVSCSEKPGSDDNTEAKPTNRSMTEIQFVSRLSDETLIADDGDYNALNDYIGKTLEGKKGSYLTVLDRADGSSVEKMMKISVNTLKYSVFALNGWNMDGNYEGSAVFFNDPLRKSVSHPVGDKAYVCGFSPVVKGVFQKLDENGNVTSSNDVTSEINFYTVRISTDAQVAAFGGASGTMETIKKENRNLILIGTVRNTLMESLAKTVKDTDSAYNVKEVVKGAGYSVFMLCNDRFWNYYGYEETVLTDGMVSYRLSVGWK